MKRKLMMVGVAIVMLSIVFVAASLHAVSKPIPFVGMSMVYYANTSVEGMYMRDQSWNWFYPRSVVVLKYYLEDETVLIADAVDYLRVHVPSRTITSATGSYADAVGGAVEYWIPTDVKIGSSVSIYKQTAEVIGSAVLSVEGRDVDCWQLYRSGTENGAQHQTTWYYAKSTGLWIAASWVMSDADGNVLTHWAGHLASTNVPL